MLFQVLSGEMMLDLKGITTLVIVSVLLVNISYFINMFLCAYTHAYYLLSKLNSFSTLLQVNLTITLMIIIASSMIIYDFI
jgi:hypothetical protein